MNLYLAMRVAELERERSEIELARQWRYDAPSARRRSLRAGVLALAQSARGALSLAW